MVISGGEQGMSYVLPPARKFVAQQVNNNFDSQHTLRFGGVYPGDYMATCLDEPDTEIVELLNGSDDPVNVYFIVNGFEGAEGAFVMKWIDEDANYQNDTGALN